MRQRALLLAGYAALCFGAVQDARAQSSECVIKAEAAEVAVTDAKTGKPLGILRPGDHVYNGTEWVYLVFQGHFRPIKESDSLGKKASARSALGAPSQYAVRHNRSVQNGHRWPSTGLIHAIPPRAGRQRH